ncbi:MAG TPA: O-antigen ligase family protein [Candidatus Saccharimonadales bacterium]
MKKRSNTLNNRLPLLSLVTFLPSVIFGYLPVVVLGSVSGVHVDLSLLYLLMAAVIALHLPFLKVSLPLLVQSPVWKILLGFTAYLWLSTIWSPNHIRAIITAGFMTSLLLLCSIIALRLPDLLKRTKLLARLSAWAFILSGVFALWQLIADALTISPTLTGLPTMYSGEVFGIARPTAFMLEPQFLGNLLILPLLWSLWHILEKTPRRTHYLILGSSVLLLSLTLSRGALIASIIGCVLLTILARRPSLSVAGWTTFTIVVSIIVSLSTTFIFAEMRPDTISGQKAVSKTISQLTLGVIDLSHPSASPVNTPSAPKEAIRSSGYIPSSTNSRLSMSSMAFNTWRTNPQTTLFGVGVGGFGTSLNPSQPGVIVNNYYLELLAETGIIGTLLFITFTALLLWHLTRQRQWLLLSLIVGLLVQMNFFSGNANIVHIWVIIALAMGVTIHSKQKSMTDVF